MNLYRTISKMCHPDISTFTNAGDMMVQVNRFKNDPNKLVSLAKKWGLPIPGIDTMGQKVNETKEDFSQRVYEAVVGALVVFGYTYRKKHRLCKGIIVNIREITKGKMAGAKEYTIYDTVTKSFIIKKAQLIPFNIVGMAEAHQIETFKDMYKDSLEKKKAQKASKDTQAGYAFSYHSLAPNMNYEGKGYKIQVGDGKYYTLIRTSAKCAFYWDHNLNKERRVNASNIMACHNENN